MKERRTPPSASKALVDKAVRHLEGAILTGTIGPGQQLSEQALAAELGVGRGPLREAVRNLEGRRLVVRTPFSGARVVSLTLDDFEQLLILREALEGMASRHAAERMTLPEVRELRANLVAFSQRVEQEGLGDAFAHRAQNQDFHFQIVRGSRNRWLEEFLCRDLYSLIRIFWLRTASVERRHVAAVAEHYEILNAIERRDPDRAETTMRAHIANSRENLISRLRKA
ncbi:MAG TPA: GntR family transcriptional regulator [Acetobacteraceae bacterium]|nr:GntR family transcriptional regulator [Acetobacteraceae bacterium]